MKFPPPDEKIFKVVIAEVLAHCANPDPAAGASLQAPPKNIIDLINVVAL